MSRKKSDLMKKKARISLQPCDVCSMKEDCSYARCMLREHLRGASFSVQSGIFLISRIMYMLYMLTYLPHLINDPFPPQNN